MTTGPEEIPSDPEQLQALVDEFAWFHSIDLGNGVQTKGLTDLKLYPEQLPPVSGRSVLDIGAWDGYYSFLAEREGAARVVALDHYAWGVDFMARGRYWEDCAAKQQLPDHSRDTTDFWQPELPGRRGFDLARRALHSAVEPVTADFMTIDLEELGHFDVVFYFGVLYHMKEPLSALERLRRVTDEVAVIETLALHVPGREDSSLLQFEAADRIGTDFGNWYVPSETALRELCRAAGFRTTKTVLGPARDAPRPAPTVRHRVASGLRAVTGASAPPPAHEHYRALVHAFV